MTAHSKLGPSGAHRWINCPGSVRAQEEAVAENPSLAGGSSEAADEGTAAHELLEAALMTGGEPVDFVGSTFNGFVVDDEMADAVAVATDYIRAYLATHPKATMVSEQTLPIPLGSAFLNELGTSDVIIDNYPDEYVVIDYKHGIRHVVEVENNPQAMLYAASYRSHVQRVPTRFRLVIVQPRAPHAKGPVREWVIVIKQLSEFMEMAREKALLTLEPNAPRAAGPWCTFCRAAGTCRTQAMHALSVAAQEFDDFQEMLPLTAKNPLTLTPEQIGYALSQLDVMEDFANAIRGYALGAINAGRKIPGWVVVKGRTRRVYSKSEDEVYAEVLQAGISLDHIAPRKLGSPAQLERACRALGIPYESFSSLVTRSKPALHLASERDPRPAVAPGAEFQDDVLT